MSNTSSPSEQEAHGWFAVPRSLSKLLILHATSPSTSVPIDLTDLPDPSTLSTNNSLLNTIHEYAHAHLPRQTLNHSLRVYAYARAIQTQHFPTWPGPSASTLLLASLLHDIGTIPSNQSSTNLSFEFQGGYIALDLLKSHPDSSISQAEAICETIIRHQDLGETGNVTALTAIIHFATVLDNVGMYPELVHEETVKRVVAEWPREGWTGCFAATVRRECEGKPWANTTRIEGFAEMVEGNEGMAEYD